MVGVLDLVACGDPVRSCGDEQGLVVTFSFFKLVLASSLLSLVGEDSNERNICFFM